MLDPQFQNAAASSRPLRILMTTDTVGGVWTYALDLARALAAYQVQVTLAALGASPSPSQRRDASTIPCLQLLCHSGKLEWMPDPWEDVDAQGRWLLQLESEVRPHLIHLNGYAHASLPFTAPAVVVAHSCVVSWWRAVKGEEAPRDWDTYRDRVTSGLGRAKAIVAPTRAMAGELQGGYGSDFTPPRVIPNGRTLPALPPFGLASYSGRKWPFILSAGRLWDEAKNLTALDRVAPLLGWPVYVAGDDTDPGTGKKALPVEGGTRRLGRLTPDHLLGFLRRAGVYTLPARYEPFGLSVLEAALCGCMLVLSDIPSLRENWDGAALFVPPDDTMALKDALCRAASDDSLRRTLADEARQRAQGLTSDAMARRYRALYEELV